MTIPCHTPPRIPAQHPPVSTRPDQRRAVTGPHHRRESHLDERHHNDSHYDRPYRPHAHQNDHAPSGHRAARDHMGSRYVAASGVIRQQSPTRGSR